MKVYLDQDEKWPVYDFSDLSNAYYDYGLEAEIDDEEYSHFRQVEEDYWQMQDRLETLYNEARDRKLAQ